VFSASFNTLLFLRLVPPDKTSRPFLSRSRDHDPTAFFFHISIVTLRSHEPIHNHHNERILLLAAVNGRCSCCGSLGSPPLAAATDGALADVNADSDART
jgi:hypothetical protein